MKTRGASSSLSYSKVLIAMLVVIVLYFVVEQHIVTDSSACCSCDAKPDAPEVVKVAPLVRKENDPLCQHRWTAAGDPQVLFFIHLHKVGGTSMRHLMLSSAASAGLRVPGPGETNMYNPKLLFDLDAMFNAPWIDKSELEARRYWDVYYIHMQFGLHTHAQIGKPFGYLAVLREPVSKFVSWYYHIRNIEKIGPFPPEPFKAEKIHKSVVDKLFLAVKEDPEELYRRYLTISFDNEMTRLICGEPATKVKFGQLGESHVACAKRNLVQHFYAVGIYERMEETLSLFSSKLPWLSRDLEQHNKKAHPTDLDDATHKRIADFVKWDTQLYEFAVQLFEGDLRNANFLVEL